MTYHVKMTDCAVQQLEASARYIALELKQPDTAKKWLARMHKKLTGLNELPHRVPLAEEQPWRDRGVHKMRAENFIAYFWIDEAARTVWVIAFIYAGRSQPDALRRVEWERSS